MPLILPPSPPALVAPAALVRPIAAPWVVRGLDVAGALREAALERRAAVLDEGRSYHPLPWWQRPAWPDPPPLAEIAPDKKVELTADSSFEFTGLPGMTYVIVAGSIVGKAFNIGGTGSLSQPIVLRGRVDSDNPNDWPEIVDATGPLFTGTRIILYRVRVRNANWQPVNYKLCRIARCQFYGIYATSGSSVLRTITPDTGSDMRVDRCQFTSKGTYPFQDTTFRGVGGVKNFESCFNEFVGFVNTPDGFGASIPSIYYCNTGETPLDYGGGYSFWMHHNLTHQGDSQIGTNNKKNAFEFYEAKTTDSIANDNTIMYDISGGVGIHIRSRHGLRTKFFRNLYYYKVNLSRGGDIEARDVDGLFYENASLNQDGSVNTSSHLNLFDGNLDADQWLQTRIPDSGQNWENCKRAKAGGNAMPVTTGGTASGGIYPIAKYLADYCTIAPASGARGDRNYTVDLGRAGNPDSSTVLPYQYANGLALTPLGVDDVGVALP